MKILILVDNLGSGGMQAQLVNLINGLTKHGYEIHLVLYHPNNDKEFFCDAIDLSNINISRLGASGGFKFKVVKYIYSQSNTHEIILSFLHSANLYVTLAKIMNSVTRKNKQFRNIVVDMSTFSNRKTWKLSIMSFFSMLFADRVISNSYTQNSYYLGLPGGKNKSIFIPNGVDDKRFLQPYKKWESENQNFLLIVGRVSRAKNGPAFVKALKKLSIQNGKLYKVLWVGRFDEDQMAKDDKKQMDNLIFELSSQNLVDWTWVGEVANVESYYKHAKCLVIPSRWEGVPNVLVEAMLAGCPVISTPVSDMPNILGNSDRGIICEGIEAEHIAKGIQTFDELESRKINDMRLKAQQFATKHFCVDSMIKKYINAIEEVS